MDASSVLDPALLAGAAGKTAIVTGAANGIGAAIAALYNASGANVVLADLAPQSSAAEANIATFKNPSNAIFVGVDILNWGQMKTLFKTAETSFERGRIDYVVANAGIMETSVVLEVDGEGELEESLEAWKVIDVNLKGTMNTLRLGLHHMAPHKSGSIVLVSSTSGYFGGTGVSAYCASKHGVVGLLRSSQLMAKKLGVRVNGVAPFFTPTHITSSYSDEWKKQGMESNTLEGIAAVVVGTSLTEGSGKCVVACGKIIRELEESRMGLLGKWLGEDFAELMGKAGKFFASIGGYPLPKRKA